MLDHSGLHGGAATAAHAALVWGGDATLYRALGVAPAPWHWDSATLATDVFHKSVYAVVTGLVYDALKPGSSKTSGPPGTKGISIASDTVPSMSRE